jgi:hypothetical protein
MPALEKLFSETDPLRGNESRTLPISVMGISIDDRKDSLKIEQALKEMSVTFPNAPAFCGDISKAYWTWGIPVTYIIDPQGQFIGRLRGGRDWASPEMITFLKKLVTEYAQ